MLCRAHKTALSKSTALIKDTNHTDSLSVWIYFGILRLGFTKSIRPWHLKKPKLFKRASSGKLNNMFLWAKACRSISEPLAMLRLAFESARFHFSCCLWWVRVCTCLSDCMSLFVNDRLVANWYMYLWAHKYAYILLSLFVCFLYDFIYLFFLHIPQVWLCKFLVSGLLLVSASGRNPVPRSYPNIETKYALASALISSCLKCHVLARKQSSRTRYGSPVSFSENTKADKYNLFQFGVSKQ